MIPFLIAGHIFYGSYLNAGNISDLLSPPKRQKLSAHQVQPPESAMVKAPSVEDCREKLSNLYLEMLNLSDIWPPLKLVKFVNLALVEQHKHAQHIGLKTVSKDIDEVCGTKTQISLDNLFTDVDHGSLILLEGRPGSGKTTLMLKISCDWGSGELLQQAKLVILVQLRRLNQKKYVYLSDLLTAACNRFSSQEIQLLSSFIERNLGEGVVFLLDGFDEYASGADENNFITKLIMKQFFSKSIVVVSSRPAATRPFREHAKIYIEVAGFLKSQIFDYIHSYYEDEEEASHLIQHLETHPNILHICYLPLHCAMLVYLSKQSFVLPKTETEFYHDFTISTLLRSCRKRGRFCDAPFILNSYDLLQPDDKAVFDRICKLAYEATMNSKQVFSYFELCNYNLQFKTGSTGSDNSSLSLLVIDQYFVKFGLDETYTFMHLTLQEYLSAVHLASLDDSQRIVAVKEHCAKEHLTVVWRFLCGILKYSNPSTKQILDVILTATAKNDLLHVQCAYEFQCEQSSTRVFQFHKNSFSFIRLVSSDCTSLIYLLENASYDNVKLTFESCSLSSSDYAAIFQSFHDHQVSLKFQ